MLFTFFLHASSTIFFLVFVSFFLSSFLFFHIRKFLLCCCCTANQTNSNILSILKHACDSVYLLRLSPLNLSGNRKKDTHMHREWGRVKRRRKAMWCRVKHKNDLWELTNSKPVFSWKITVWKATQIATHDVDSAVSVVIDNIVAQWTSFRFVADEAFAALAHNQTVSNGFDTIAIDMIYRIDAITTQ